MACENVFRFVVRNEMEVLAVVNDGDGLFDQAVFFKAVRVNEGSDKGPVVVDWESGNGVVWEVDLDR